MHAHHLLDVAVGASIGLVRCYIRAHLVHTRRHVYVTQHTQCKIQVTQCMISHVSRRLGGRSIRRVEWVC